MRQKAINIIKTLKEHGFEAYLVGGCVRDTLLNKDVKDYDVTTNATPEQVQEIFNCISCGNNFLVSLVDGIEVATFRLDKGDKAVHATSLKEDVIRRDFTINGIAYDIDSDSYIDYVGGVKDLNARVLRFIGDPGKRIIEDPVRIIRGLRFMSTLNLTPDYNTHFALLKYRELVKQVPRERIKDEIIKAFKHNAYRFVMLLLEYELLQLIFPSVYNLLKIEGGHHHNETVFTHCLNALKSIDFPQINYRVKLAALYHDTGKAQTQVLNEDTNTLSFHGHEKISHVLAQNDFKALKFSNEDVAYISNLCLVHMFPFVSETSLFEVRKPRVKKLLVKLKELNINVKDFLFVRFSDNHANMLVVRDIKYVKSYYRQILNILKEQPPFSIKDLEINGYDVMERGFTGKAIGAILKLIFDKVLSGNIPNERDVLIQELDYLVNI